MPTADSLERMKTMSAPEQLDVLVALERSLWWQHDRLKTRADWEGVGFYAERIAETVALQRQAVAAVMNLGAVT